ncbi:unnamed protein product [Linum tenue]|uniref:Reticulon-like protein n=1 Tax=Linum tenue TaxID=586396 RepID=A0AAV0Q388_9ROSI|nr:unnamed protein product [Linum tenue]
MRISSHFRREHHVYTVEACDRSSFRVPELCRVMKSVQIPFGYSRYLADDEFGVGLTWKTVLGGFLANSFVVSALCNKLFKFGLCVAAAATLLLIMKMYRTNRVEKQLDSGKLCLVDRMSDVVQICSTKLADDM